MSDSRPIHEIEAEIVEDFELFDSWDDKYEYIIDLGKKLEPMDPAHKIDENRVKGCQSIVWMAAEYREGKIHFTADSDAVIVKGLISLLIRVMSGHTPDEILDTKLEFLEKIGMHNHLAQTRSNGLLSMVKQMKNYALAYKIKNSNQVNV